MLSKLLHRRRAQALPRILAVATLAALPFAVQAGAITGIAIVNESSPDFLSDTGTRVREFRTDASAPTLGTAIGDTVSFDSRFAWMLGHRVLPGGPTVALLSSQSTEYDGHFVSVRAAFNAIDPPAQIPEPGSLAPTGLGLLLVGARHARRRTPTA